jgi:DNA-directed RNA polymerase beta subunit
LEKESSSKRKAEEKLKIEQENKRKKQEKYRVPKPANWDEFKDKQMEELNSLFPHLSDKEYLILKFQYIVRVYHRLVKASQERNKMDDKMLVNINDTLLTLELVNRMIPKNIDEFEKMIIFKLNHNNEPSEVSISTVSIIENNQIV